jgi:hypothetical protein
MACASNDRPATVQSGLSGAADRKRLPSPAASRIAVEITSLADDESFDGGLHKVVRHLFGRMLAEIRCRSIDGAALSAIAPVNVSSGDDCTVAAAVAPNIPVHGPIVSFTRWR